MTDQIIETVFIVSDLRDIQPTPAERTDTAALDNLSEETTSGDDRPLGMRVK